MILYLLPRIHQNIVNEFLEHSYKNNNFQIICLNNSLNDYRFKPFIIKEFLFLSHFSRLILGDLPNKGYIIPSIDSMAFIVNSIKKSKVVILREIRFPSTLFSLIIVFIFRKDLILKIQHPNNLLPFSYLMLKRIFDFFKLKIEIHNALPFSSSNILFKPFKKPFIKFKPVEVDQLFKNISITTIGKLEERKQLLFPLVMAKELEKSRAFDSIILNLFVTYKDIDSKRILKELNIYSEKLKKKSSSTIVNLKIQAENSEVLDTLTKSHIYLHPAENEPASYSIIEAFSCGAYVISRDNCFTTDYLPFKNCSKKFKEFTPIMVSNFIVENFENISNDKNRIFRSFANFVER